MTGELRFRPLAYNNIDGVGELGMGFMMLSWSLLAWFLAHSPKGSAWHSMPVFILYLGGMLLTIHYGSKTIKNRLTYPRTGFVEYRRQDHWRWGILGGVVAPLFLAGLVAAHRLHWSITTPAVLVGLLFAASYTRIARTVPWKWAVFGLMTSGSLLLAVLPADWFIDHSMMGAIWLIFALYGILFLISGGISLWLYVRHTPLPAREEA